MGWKVITATGGIKSGTSVSTITSANGLIGKQVITTTGAGTYTPTAGTTSIVIEMVGGGGGGGGATTGTAGQSAIAQSGTAGAYLKKRLTTAFSGASYSVGAKGTGGGAGNNNGNDGTDTTFTQTGGGTVYTAGKGTGGLAAAANATGAPPAQRVASSAGGTATNGDINMAGGTSVPGFAMSTTRGISCMGGSSMFGRPGNATQVNAVNSSVAGNAATGYGAGGNGGLVLGTGASVAGGDGTDGILIIWEYGS